MHWNLITMLYAHIDLDFYSLGVIDLCFVAPIPGNQNIERQEDPDNEDRYLRLSDNVTQIKN